ncbi:hypothetical protein [Bacillus infantis]|uniref:Uncharacterized protein n=1 Tax=Bacillus infantis TaxID=324767 RepID=A0A5D4RIC8_9BACI|nr:hypothetical protein [Bacillus infantis]TYS50091.1 hypothetical protein FZD51_05925 [Bacillus infantis]
MPKKQYSVIKTFRDKDTKERVKKDSVYEHSNSARIKDLQRRGFLGEELQGEGSLLDQNIEDVTEALQGLSADELKSYLEEEKKNKNRKTVIEYIESALKDGDTGESGTV